MPRAENAGSLVGNESLVTFYTQVLPDAQSAIESNLSLDRRRTEMAEVQSKLEANGKARDEIWTKIGEIEATPSVQPRSTRTTFCARYETMQGGGDATILAHGPGIIDGNQYANKRTPGRVLREETERMSRPEHAHWGDVWQNPRGVAAIFAATTEAADNQDTPAAVEVVGVVEVAEMAGEIQVVGLSGTQEESGRPEALGANSSEYGADESRTHSPGIMVQLRISKDGSATSEERWSLHSRAWNVGLRNHSRRDGKRQKLNFWNSRKGWNGEFTINSPDGKRPCKMGDSLSNSGGAEETGQDGCASSRTAERVRVHTSLTKALTSMIAEDGTWGAQELEEATLSRSEPVRGATLSDPILCPQASYLKESDAKNGLTRSGCIDEDGIFGVVQIKKNEPDVHKATESILTQIRGIAANMRILTRDPMYCSVHLFSGDDDRSIWAGVKAAVTAGEDYSKTTNAIAEGSIGGHAVDPPHTRITWRTLDTDENKRDLAHTPYNRLTGGTAPGNVFYPFGVIGYYIDRKDENFTCSEAAIGIYLSTLLEPPRPGNGKPHYQFLVWIGCTLRTTNAALEAAHNLRNTNATTATQQGTGGAQSSDRLAEIEEPSTTRGSVVDDAKREKERGNRRAVVEAANAEITDDPVETAKAKNDKGAQATTTAVESDDRRGSAINK
ncbi:unnamed protein product [Bathycoccus prasinos]